MLQINYIREHKTEALERLQKRNIQAEELFNEIIQKDDLRKDTQSKLDNVLAQSNQIAKEIGQYFKNGEKEKAEEAKLKTVELKQASKSLTEELNNHSRRYTSSYSKLFCRSTSDQQKKP